MFMQHSDPLKFKKADEKDIIFTGPCSRERAHKVPFTINMSSTMDRPRNAPRRWSRDTAISNSSKHSPIIMGFAAVIVVYTYITLTTFSRVHSSAEVSNAMSTVPREMFIPGDSENIDAIIHAPVDTNDPIYKLRHTFPLHVGNSTQVIPHPGLQLMTNPSKAHRMGLSDTMSLPKFFDDSHGHVYPGGSVRNFLGSGHRLMTPEQATAVGSFDAAGRETIYCSVASYRDPECAATVEDLYARALNPERLRVAILDQRVPNSTDSVCSEPAIPCEQDATQALCQYRHLIDYFSMDAALAVGPVFARHAAQRFYRGEYYAMQLDSHVRMTEGWDDDIIKQWKSANNEYAVLSTYVSDLNGRIDPITHKATNPSRPIMCNAGYEGRGDNQHLRFEQQPEGPAGIHGQPTLHPFWAAGFSFGRGHFVIQVPYDQYLPMIFQGEEISMTLRGYSYGYDYYAPERGVCYHMYAVKANKAKREKVPLFWENTNTYSGVAKKAMKRLNSLIGLIEYPFSEWLQDDKTAYGLGTIRNTSKFFKTFGIHTAKHTVEGHLCRFVGKPMMKEFLPALRKNRMGLDWDKISYVFVDPLPNEKVKGLFAGSHAVAARKQNT